MTAVPELVKLVGDERDGGREAVGLERVDHPVLQLVAAYSELWRSTAAALPQHDRSTITALPRHYHGTTTALPRHYHSTTTVLPQH